MYIARLREAARFITSPRVMRYIAMAIILTGIILRCAIYLQNRNLFIDEANVARNIYERDLAGLAQPLSYEQYAPPVFLWAVKGSATLWGDGEYALKLYPFLCGILSLWLLYRVLWLLDVRRVVWYPLLLFATGYIYLRYATELKQYSSDTLVALALVWLGLRADIRTARPVQFLILWVGCGSLAIWSAMPSVFVLAGIGIYYSRLIWQERRFERVWLLVILLLVWVCQFGYYYLTILRPQADSSYLQNYHKNDFLYLLPHSLAQWQHNGAAMLHVLGATAGHWTLSLVFHIVCLVAGSIAAVRGRDSRWLLLAVPVAALLIAAALHQFSLQPRVILFVMPLLLIWIGVGMECLIDLPFAPQVLVPVALICVVNYAQLHYLREPLRVTDVTDCFPYMEKCRREGARLYIDGSAASAYIYYTEIHPARARWAGVKGAICLPYGADMDAISATMPDRVVILYSYYEPAIMQMVYDALGRHMVSEGVYKGRMGSQVLLLRKR